MNGISALRRAVVVLSMGALAMLLASSCAKTAEETTSKTETVAPSTVAVTPPTEAPHWDYEDAGRGPADWGSLSPAFIACAEGLAQSPIDIDETASADLPVLRAHYKPAELHIIHQLNTSDVMNTGHSVQVNFPSGDTLFIGDEAYALVQFHFHSPSEHTVKGKRYPMEMHLVHKSAAGKLAVVGVFIEEGAHNPHFDKLWAHLPTAKGVETHVPDVSMDMRGVMPTDLRSYRYEGSLTTPPCTEGVHWTVLATPIALSAEQIAAFRKVMHGNSRPVQRLNGRKVVTDVVAKASAN